MKPSPEALWLCVFTGAGAIGVAWVGSGLPVPRCPFHALTEIPCPGCGSTRAFRCMAGLNVLEALQTQPLFAAILLGILSYCVYAAGALAGLWKRWRRPPPLPSELARWRVGAAVAIAANWAYLVWRARG